MIGEALTLADLSGAAPRRKVEAAAPHRFHHAAVHKPSGVVLAAELTTELVRAEALLARIRHMEHGGPLRQPCMAAFHNRAGRDAEVPTALRIATAIATNLLGRVVLLALAVRANRARRPAGGFEPRPAGLLIVKIGPCKLALGHGTISLLWPRYRNKGRMVSTAGSA